MDVADETARRMGAVNTVIVKADGTLFGTNTDGYGFIQGLYSNTSANIGDSQILILGAGGSAKAVLLSLMDIGPKGMCIANRSYRNAELLRDSCNNNRSDIHVIAIEDSLFVSYVQNADVIVNCTTIGMKNTDGILPFTYKDIHSDTILYDLVYNPLRTLMLREGEKANSTLIGGIDMLVHQGAKSFELWFEMEAPTDVMLKSAKSVIL